MKKNWKCFGVLAGQRWQSGARGLSLAALTLLAALQCAPATVLVVEQVGDGSSKLTNSASPVFLQSRNLDGLLLGSVSCPLGMERPVSPPFHLLESGGSASDGQLTRSANGLLIQVPGYNATNGEPGIANSSASVVWRTIGVLNADLVLDTSRAASMLTSNNYRSVVSVDGSAFWAAGHPGVTYVAGSQVTPLVSLNFRNINIFNGQLFGTMGGTVPGIYTVGTGLPTTAPVQPFIYLPVGGWAGSPYGFQFDTSMTTCYVADEGTNQGIVKFTYSSGAWSSNYTLGTGSYAGARGLAVDWSQPSAPVIYATTAETSSNRLVRIIDTGASSAALTLATAAHHTILRGVDFLGLPAVWRYASSGNLSAGDSTPWYNWSVCLANGINLQFQNVNTGTTPLSLSVTNNTSLSWVTSIAFTAAGYGGAVGCSYTLRGSGLTLGGGGLTSDSPLVQTVKLPLAVGAPQTLKTGPGDIVLDGVLSGTNAVAKSGSGAVVLNAVNTYSGAFTVNEGSLLVNGRLTNSMLNVVSGTLSGTGAITGPVTVQTQGILAPGGSNLVGVLSINGLLNLLGTTSMEISKSGTNRLCDSVVGITDLTCGGALNVTLGSGSLEAGDAFVLFQAFAYAGSFQNINLPPLSPDLYWDTTLLGSAGTIRVGAVLPPKLNAPSRNWDGTVQLSFAGPPGLTFQVWATEDPTLQPIPTTWTFLGSGAFAADGTASFSDFTAPFYQHRFYAVSVP